jgi:Arc/MetJ-type ribon-helix-helix transcriptional regulator
MVYTDVPMGRTQIYLGDEELDLLDRAASRTGASRSELIRRAVRGTFGEASKQDKLAALRASAGSWSAGPSGAEFVDAVRGDLNQRLRRLGLDK